MTVVCTSTSLSITKVNLSYSPGRHQLSSKQKHLSSAHLYHHSSLSVSLLLGSIGYVLSLLCAAANFDLFGREGFSFVKEASRVVDLDVADLLNEAIFKLRRKSTMAQQSIITQVSRDNDSYQPCPAPPPDRGKPSPSLPPSLSISFYYSLYLSLFRAFLSCCLHL